MVYKCKYCGWIGRRSNFEIDHEIPVSRLPFLTQMANLSLICSGCNRQKGNKTPREYILWRLLNPNIKNFGPI